MVHITKTLLESWRYCFSCYEGYEEEAYADFLKTLRREQTETTEAMLNGLAFEDRVYRIAEGKTVRSDAKWRTGATALADIIRGAQIQVPISRPIEVDGKIDSTIVDDMRRAPTYKSMAPPPGVSQIVQYNAIQEWVNRYDFEVACGLRMMEEYNALCFDAEGKRRSSRL